MNREKSFFRTVCALAIPVALQSMLQASFSVIDQIMIGQLGTVSVAGVGLAGKFSSIYSVLVSAIAAVAGIMISQYMGQKNAREVRRSFSLNLLLTLGLAAVFTLPCLLFPEGIMGLYTQDAPTRLEAANYLRIISAIFLPMAGATMLSTLLRCREQASLPLIASMAAALLNTGLNYVLIFGKFGFAPMGAQGAAIATAVSQIANFALMLVLFLAQKREKAPPKEALPPFNWKQYAAMLLPVLACEFLWSLGENVYAVIYGHLGTDATAAMTLINPIQSLMIGALCGLSQAASVLVGKQLGNREYDGAYTSAKKILLYGLGGSLLLSAVILAIRGVYVEIYEVDAAVKALTRQILLAYAIIAPCKVLNMIVGGGILRSGGKTEYVMFIDIIGTWVFGVPLGLLAAFVLNLSIPWVYFLLSLEECVRLGVSLVLFRKKKWMRSLEA